MGDMFFNLLLFFYSNTFDFTLLYWDLLEFCTFFFSYPRNSFYYHFTTNYTFFFTFKLGFSLIFLATIKGGVPRYRYDFLTKLGWIKFLGLVLTIFLAVMVLYLTW